MGELSEIVANFGGGIPRFLRAKFSPYFVNVASTRGRAAAIFYL